jgi:hypothetical protein
VTRATQECRHRGVMSICGFLIDPLEIWLTLFDVPIRSIDVFP